MKCSYLVSFLTVVPINGHPFERPVCHSVHGNPWKTLVKKNSFLMAQSVSDSPHRVFVHKRVCIDLESSLKVNALALCEILVWTILSFFGPVWLILYLHRGLGQRVHVNGFRFNIRVFEYLCIKSLQVWYFLFHRPDLAHSKDYCMKCSWTKFQGQRLPKVKAKSFKMAFILLFFTN